ncbi:unnamed protein product [marine sediment metagenome]|uniref:Uncharacterized protein n=1 Tax=marine sediment metagenome TaxID=412755 RepID=X1GVH3_9ZZZZ
MVFEEDRGTIIRITFDIVYPTKQMKTVAMNMSQSDNWSDVGILHLIRKQLKEF